MEYIRVEWQHDSPDYPVLILSELDAARYETRKIEQYADGRQQCWDERNPDELGEVQTPSVAELNAIGEFPAASLTALEFESAWAQACSVRN
jgi:hypothetical protein